MNEYDRLKKLHSRHKVGGENEERRGQRSGFLDVPSITLSLPSDEGLGRHVAKMQTQRHLT